MPQNSTSSGNRFPNPNDHRTDAEVLDLYFGPIRNSVVDDSLLERLQEPPLVALTDDEMRRWDKVLTGPVISPVPGL